MRADGAGVSGVTITFLRNLGSGSLPGSVVTGANGRWSQSGFETLTSYTANLNKVGFNFQPAAAVFSGPRSDLNFEGTTDPFVKSGKVTILLRNLDRGVSTEASVPGVTILFERVSGPGAVPASVTTDTNGHWTKSGFEGDTIYKATPKRGGMEFTPASAQFRYANPINDLKFEGQVSIFVVSGTISHSAGAKIGGTIIKFTRVSGTGAVPSPAETDANGKWSQKLEKGTVYQATPLIEGFTFTPPSSVSLSNTRSDINFEAHSILVAASGKVIRRDGNGLARVTITFAMTSGIGQVPFPVQTDASGNWSQSGFSRGSTYSALPTRNGFSFGANSLRILRIEDVTGELTVPQIVALLIYRASGRVTFSDLGGLPNVPIDLLDDSLKVIAATKTDSSGNWRSIELEEGKNFAVVANQRKPFAVFANQPLFFSPASYSFNGPRSNLNFVLPHPNFVVP